MAASNPEKMDKTNSETGYCGHSPGSSPKPNRPGYGKCYTASAVDRSHSPDQAIATNPWRSFWIGIPGTIHQVLETSPPFVEPDTLLRWHRDIFRFYWKRKSKPKRKEPRISPETIHLIKQMANENRLWGAERIRGELLKLGIQVSTRTIQRYLPKERKTSTQTWVTFLKNHASGIWACDFTVVYDLLFRPIFIFVILELKTRLIIHSAVTTSPTDEWTAQQLREASPWGSHPKYLI
jgi:hypothetical protein